MFSTGIPLLPFKEVLHCGKARQRYLTQQKPTIFISTYYLSNLSL